MSAPTLGLFVPTHQTDYDAVSASIWIRALQMIPHLRALGISVALNNPFRRYDAAIVYRTPSRSFYLLCRLLQKTCGRLYFDTVVNYFIPHARATPAHLYYQMKIAELCDGVICSTDPIAEDARRFCSRVHVMDDPLDTGHFAQVKETIDYDRPQWGWSGVSVKADPLLAYRHALRDPILLITDDGIRRRPFDMPYRYRQWSHATFPGAILECDLALLPRDSSGDPYNSGHSAFKALVFAASGVPVVATRLPSYAKMARFYPAMAFLEDHGNDPSACAAALRGCRSGAVDALRQEYGCREQARRLAEFVGLSPR